MLIFMVFLPILAALVCYPLCGRSEKAWFTPVLAVTLAADRTQDVPVTLSFK